MTGILTNRVLFTLALMLIVAAAGTHWMNTGTASADYLPPLLPDYLPIGPAGGNVADLTGMINESDAATKWNQWTGTNKLSATGTSTSGCGTSKACIVYSNDNQYSIFNGRLCYVPSTSTSATWATTFLDAGSYFSNVCAGLVGSAARTVFVVAFNNELTGWPSIWLTHIGRHEIGHALKLGDAPSSVSCWTSGNTIYPLMKNNVVGCSSHGSNVTASTNEASYAKQRTGW